MMSLKYGLKMCLRITPKHVVNCLKNLSVCQIWESSPNKPSDEEQETLDLHEEYECFFDFS